MQAVIEVLKRLEPLRAEKLYTVWERRLDLLLKVLSFASGGTALALVLYAALGRESAQDWIKYLMLILFMAVLVGYLAYSFLALFITLKFLKSPLKAALRRLPIELEHDLEGVETLLPHLHDLPVVRVHLTEKINQISRRASLPIGSAATFFIAVLSLGWTVQKGVAIHLPDWLVQIAFDWTWPAASVLGFATGFLIVCIASLPVLSRLRYYVRLIDLALVLAEQRSFKRLRTLRSHPLARRRLMRGYPDWRHGMSPGSDNNGSDARVAPHSQARSQRFGI